MDAFCLSSRYEGLPHYRLGGVGIEFAMPILASTKATILQ